MPLFPKLLRDVLSPIDSPPLDWAAQNSFSSDDWKEAVNLYSPAQLSIGRKKSYATLTGYVPYAKLQDALLWLLGYSWVDVGGYLRRQIPANHPLFNGLFASDITECVGVKFITKLAKSHGWGMPYASYSLAKVTIAYSQPPFDVVPDSALYGHSQNPLVDMVAYRGQELRRWCFWTPKPYVDLLAVPGGTEQFAAGPYVNKPASFALKTLVRAQKSTTKLVWKDVPIEFLCNKYGAMVKIEQAIGTCNKDQFFGGDETIHTWLLDDVDLVGQEAYADPLALQAAVFVGNQGNKPGSPTILPGITRRMDVVFTFRHFAPSLGAPAYPERGWRLRPGWDGNWYPVTKTLGGGNAFPDETDFMKMFTWAYDL